MSSIRMTPITGPKAWRGADLATDPSWIVTFTAAELAEIDRALAAATLAGAAPRVVHASNSAAVLRFPDAAFAWVRPGIARPVPMPARAPPGLGIDVVA
jgi:hypothetical protein